MRNLRGGEGRGGGTKATVDTTKNMQTALSYELNRINKNEKKKSHFKPTASHPLLECISSSPSSPLPPPSLIPDQGFNLERHKKTDCRASLSSLRKSLSSALTHLYFNWIFFKIKVQQATPKSGNELMSVWKSFLAFFDHELKCAHNILANNWPRSSKGNTAGFGQVHPNENTKGGVADLCSRIICDWGSLDIQ